MTASGPIRRFGMVIGLREECRDAYVALHAGSGVRDLLAAANIRNFSIYLHRLPDGRLYEFGYHEYSGESYEADMAALAAHPRNADWLELCGAMQLPLPGETGWAEMNQVFYNP